MQSKNAYEKSLCVYWISFQFHFHWLNYAESFGNLSNLPCINLTGGERINGDKEKQFKAKNISETEIGFIGNKSCSIMGNIIQTLKGV